MKLDTQNLQQAINESGPQVAERLVEFRHKAQLSIQDLIDATGLSRSGIAKIESGDASPTVKTVALYVAACGRTLSEFFRPWKEKRELTGSRK